MFADEFELQLVFGSNSLAWEYLWMTTGWIFIQTHLLLLLDHLEDVGSDVIEVVQVGPRPSGRRGCCRHGESLCPRHCRRGSSSVGGDDWPLTLPWTGALALTLLVQPPFLARAASVSLQQASYAQDLRHGHDAVQPVLRHPDLPAVDVLHQQGEVGLLHLIEDDDGVVWRWRPGQQLGEVRTRGWQNDLQK